VLHYDRTQLQGSQPIALTASVAQVQGQDFSPLEWSVIRLARNDPLWTIRPAGPFRRFWNWLMARGNPRLANPRLEALRRMAVLSWHYGFAVSGEDLADFLSEGFGVDQYELLVGSVSSVASRSTEVTA
jgi:hypothetical protein